MRYLFTLLLLISLLTVSQRLRASHIRAGEIRIERPDCETRTVLIHLTGYVDPGSSILFGEGILSLGDGNIVVVPELTAEELPGYPGVGVVRYTVEHTYLSDGQYRVSYQEPNRNPGTVNMLNAEVTSFYTESVTEVRRGEVCNNTPVLNVPPIDRGCASQLFAHIPGAEDPDGDSLVYSLAVPLQGPDQEVQGFRELLEFSEQSETGGSPVVRINPESGLLTWDSPGVAGEFAVAIRIREYRLIEGVATLVGTTIRDMQILVGDCSNRRPRIFPTLDTCIVAGQTFTFPLQVVDPDGDEFQLELFGPVAGHPGFSLNPPAVISPGSLNVYSPRWETSCADVRANPYQIIFKASEVSGQKLASFAVWNIRVLAPAPQARTVSLDPGGVLLEWDPYAQCDETSSIEVYRKVGNSGYDPENCERGVRSGFTRIASLPAGATEYLDTQLIPAAKFCYRLVAVMNNGTGSKPSNEICYEFIPATRPVITHVSVTQTDTELGSTVVSWREPSSLQISQRPWRYVLERQENNTFIPVDTLFRATYTADSLALSDSGLNTLENPYIYRIRLDIPGAGEPVRYSENASSVWLETRLTGSEISLDWSAEVPWSNLIAGLDHRVYRGDPEDEALLVRVNPLTSGFTYLDNLDIDPEQLYCYRVATYGSYGNDVIPGPFVSYSQVSCTVEDDGIPPAPVTIISQPASCSELFADGSGPSGNLIQWETTDKYVRLYEVYYKESLTGEYVLLAKTTDTAFEHNRENTGLPASVKGCYRIRAVDYFGNRGELSQEYCVDHCVQFVLPNVFTPNNDGCNDRLRVISRDNINPGCNTELYPLLNSRYVEEFDIRIYNRWGQLVYSANNEDTDTFAWDGLDHANREVPGGVYFFQAEVRFDQLDPSGIEAVTGWVHILR